MKDEREYTPISERRPSGPASAPRAKVRDTLETDMAAVVPALEDGEEAGPITLPMGSDMRDSRTTLLPPETEPLAPAMPALFSTGLFAELRGLRDRFAEEGLIVLDEGDPNEHARVAAAVVLVHLVEFVDKYQEVIAEGRRRRLEVNSGLQGERYVILRIGFGALR